MLKSLRSSGVITEQLTVVALAEAYRLRYRDEVLRTALIAFIHIKTRRYEKIVFDLKQS